MSLVWRSESQMKRKNMYLCKVEIKKVDDGKCI